MTARSGKNPARSKPVMVDRAVVAPLPGGSFTIECTAGARVIGLDLERAELVELRAKIDAALAASEEQPPTERRAEPAAEEPPPAPATQASDEQIDQWRCDYTNAQNAIVSPKEPPYTPDNLFDDEVEWKRVRRELKRRREVVAGIFNDLVAWLDDPSANAYAGQCIAARLVGELGIEQGRLRELLDAVEEGSEAIRLRGGISNGEAGKLHGIAAENAYSARALRDIPINRGSAPPEDAP